jgi:hypothetical protein
MSMTYFLYDETFEKFDKVCSDVHAKQHYSGTQTKLLLCISAIPSRHIRGKDAMAHAFLSL